MQEIHFDKDTMALLFRLTYQHDQILEMNRRLVEILSRPLFVLETGEVKNDGPG